MTKVDENEVDGEYISVEAGIHMFRALSRHIDVSHTSLLECRHTAIR